MPAFVGGRNIALKLPPHLFESTRAFYLDTLGMAPIDELAPAVVVRFGTIHLWLDRVEGLGAPETWLEVVTSDLGAAGEHFAASGVERCDEVEALPEGFPGFWIRSPAAVVHLVSSAEDGESGGQKELSPGDDFTNQDR